MKELEQYHDQVVERAPVSFETPIQPDSANTSEVIAGMLRRWYIVFVVFIVICGLGIPAIWFLIEPLHTVTGIIHVAPILPNILTGEADRGEISNYESFMYTQAEMITSDRVVQRVADNLAEKNLEFFKNDATGVIAEFKRRLKGTTANADPARLLKQAIADGVIRATPGRRTELIKVSMQSTNKKEARDIVDAFLGAYMAVEVSSATEEQERKLGVLEDERRVLTEKLKTKHNAIRQLAEEYGTATLGSRRDMMLKQVTALLSKLAEVESQRIGLEARLHVLEQAPDKSIVPEELIASRNEYINSNPTVQQLTSKIIQLEQALIEARQVLASGNPQLKQKQELLEIFESSLADKRQELAKDFDEMAAAMHSKANKEGLQKVRAQLEQSKAYEQRLQEELDKQDTQTIAVGRRQLEIEDLQFQLELDREMYDAVCRRVRELEMERKRPARVRVADYADTRQVRDKRVKYSAALVFCAFGCGAMLAFLRDKADKSVRTPQDVARCIGIRIIGTTVDPHAVRRSVLPKQIAEDYQSIRANLGLLSSGGMPKKLVITSPARQEGKTTFAVNLATSIAKEGKKVLLIDGDLRKPDIGLLLKLPKGSRGLQDLLFGRNGDKAVCSVLAGLDVLAADSRNAADAYELLALPGTARYIDDVGQKYDHVIIDTPPILAFPDAMLWAKMADAVILTCKAGQTLTPDLREAKEKLAQINARVLGTVLSNVRVSHRYYRYGYDYYGSNGKQQKKSRRASAKLLLPLHESKDDSRDDVTT